MSAYYVSPQRVFDQYLPAFISALGCTISLVMTILLYAALEGDGITWLAVGVGVTMEGAKLCFATGVFNRTRALAMRCVYVVGAATLLVASISASMIYLVDADSKKQAAKDTATARQNQAALLASASFQDLQARIAPLDKQIGVLTASLQADQAGHYRTRAATTAQALQGLQLRRDVLGDQLTALNATPHAVVAPTFFHSASDVLGIPANTVRFCGYGLVAVLLEFCSLVLLISVHTAASSQEIPPGTPRLTPPRATAISTAMVPVPSTYDVQCNATETDDEIRKEPIDERYQEAKDLMREGLLTPTYRALQEVLAIGPNTAKELLHRMANEGVLLRAGRRFRVA